MATTGNPWLFLRRTTVDGTPLADGLFTILGNDSTKMESAQTGSLSVRMTRQHPDYYEEGKR